MTEAPKKSMYSPRIYQNVMMVWQEERIAELERLNKSQLDTYQNMFDALVEERKFLIQERKNDDIRQDEFNKRIKEQNAEIIDAKRLASTFREESNKLRKRLELKDGGISSKPYNGKPEDICDE